MNKTIKLLAIFIIPVLFCACNSGGRVENGLRFKTLSLKNKSKAASSVLKSKAFVEFMLAGKNEESIEEAAVFNNMVADTISEGETDIKTAIAKKQKEQMEAFKAAVSEPELSSHAFEWENILQGKVISVFGRYISYELSDFSSAGGAHPSTVLTYAVLDTNTGKQAELSNFIDEKNNSKLTKIIRNTLTQEKNAASYKALREDFLLKDLEITNNFYADDMGLHFVYNQYDIAPYSEGAQNILVRWDALKDILKPNVL